MDFYESLLHLQIVAFKYLIDEAWLSRKIYNPEAIKLLQNLPTKTTTFLRDSNELKFRLSNIDMIIHFIYLFHCCVLIPRVVYDLLLQLSASAKTNTDFVCV